MRRRDAPLTDQRASSRLASISSALALRAGPTQGPPARAVWLPNRSPIFTLPVRTALRVLRLLQVAVYRIFV
jgi:hypothetical protein